MSLGKLKHDIHINITQDEKLNKTRELIKGIEVVGHWWGMNLWYNQIWVESFYKNTKGNHEACH